MPTTRKHLVYFDSWVHPVAEGILAARDGIALERLSYDDPEAGNWAALERAHGYQVQPRGELRAPWFGDAALIARCPNLLVMSSTGAGYDYIDVEACTRAGILVVNQSGTNTEAVAEHALGMMLALSKKMPLADKRLRRSGRVERYALTGNDVMGKTVGIVGLGLIGARTAELCRGLFGMRVLAYDPYLDEGTVAARGAAKVALPELMAEADFVSVHCPRNAETLGLLGAAEFARMKPTAYFINTARGGIHDEAALADALQRGALAGAGLDVWGEEPPSHAHPLLGLDTVLATPHTAGITHEALHQMSAMAAEQWITLLEGQRPPRIVNPEVWPHYAKRFERLLGQRPDAPRGRAAAPGGGRATAATIREERGTLPDGTPYLLRVPQDWTGVVIRDLDAVNRSEAPATAPLYADMLARGYAVAGTMRHRLRMFQYDPVREIANLDRVLDSLEAGFGRASCVIQYGCSGGGHVTLAIAEDFAQRVQGGVALAAHTPVWLMNSFLDGWFALKALLGPAYEAAGAGRAEDLAIVGLANDGSAHPTAHGREGPLPEAWRRAAAIAQATPEGRARIALAFTLGQWPAWVNEETPQPALDDADALQASMYSAVRQNAANPGGEARVMFENAAQGEQLSWNDGVDYVAWFETANPAYRAAVEALYARAGLSVADDLRRLNAAPRIAASPHALAFWAAAGRTTRGDLKVPVMRLHMVGDYQIPPSLVEGYEAEVAARGRSALFRSAFVNATGHCNFTAAESAAAIEAVRRRIASGDWGDTGPARMNAEADALATGSPARFMDYGPHRQRRYNRVWHPAPEAPS